MVKPPLRTKTVGTKLSETEYAQLEAAARERGLTLSEWCRQVLLASVNGQGSKAADPTGSDQALMAELVALRTILLNLHFRMAKGEPITAEAMQEIIDRADAGKVRNARERLEQAAKKNPAAGSSFSPSLVVPYVSRGCLQAKLYRCGDERSIGAGRRGGRYRASGRC